MRLCSIVLGEYCHRIPIAAILFALKCSTRSGGRGGSSSIFAGEKTSPRVYRMTNRFFFKIDVQPRARGAAPYIYILFQQEFQQRVPCGEEIKQRTNLSSLCNGGGGGCSLRTRDTINIPLSMRQGEEEGDGAACRITRYCCLLSRI